MTREFGSGNRNGYINDENSNFQKVSNNGDNARGVGGSFRGNRGNSGNDRRSDDRNRQLFPNSFIRNIGVCQGRNRPSHSRFRQLSAIGATRKYHIYEGDSAEILHS